MLYNGLVDIFSWYVFFKFKFKLKFFVMCKESLFVIERYYWNKLYLSNCLLLKISGISFVCENICVIGWLNFVLMMGNENLKWFLVFFGVSLLIMKLFNRCNEFYNNVKLMVLFRN